MTPPKKATDPDVRDCALLIRLSGEERARLGAAAKAQHLPTGTWLRQLGLRDAERQSAPDGRKEKKVLSFITEDVLTACIEPLLSRDKFDSHAIIQELMRRREYLDEIHSHRDEQPDAFRITHAGIGKALATHPLVTKAFRTKSLNIRGGMTQNQVWRRKE